MINYYLDGWRKFAKFDGRSRRKEYWWFVLGNMILQWSLLGLAAVGGLSTVASIAYGVFSLAALIPSIAIIIRRMHDVGKSGWYCLIPIYNLVLACTDSEPGTNQYGPNPKSIEIDMSDHLVS